MPYNPNPNHPQPMAQPQSAGLPPVQPTTAPVPPPGMQHPQAMPRQPRPAVNSVVDAVMNRFGGQQPGAGPIFGSNASPGLGPKAPVPGVDYAAQALANRDWHAAQPRPEGGTGLAPINNGPQVPGEFATRPIVAPRNSFGPR